MADLTRYACQLQLSGFGKKAQEKLAKAKVLIVGMGGLGCPAGVYLTAAGIGTIGICDFDKVTLKNLHRQILYDEEDVGRIKVKVAEKKLRKQNPSVNIVCIAEKIISKNALKIINGYDIIVDCTDNFETRYLLNDASVILKKPLVYGAIFQFEGQVSVFNVKKKGKFSPNYRDIFPSTNDVAVPNCEDGGVLPTIAGVIGSIQASEVIKYITGVGELLISKLFIFDVKNLASTIITLPSVSISEIKRIVNDDIPLVTVSKLKKSITKKKFNLIDVRTPKEHKEFNIGGTNIPLHELNARFAELQLEKPLIFYCRSGVRSAQAVRQILNAYPKANIFSLDGGILAWQDKAIRA